MSISDLPTTYFNMFNVSFILLDLRSKYSFMYYLTCMCSQNLSIVWDVLNSFDHISCNVTFNTYMPVLSVIPFIETFSFAAIALLSLY